MKSPLRVSKSYVAQLKYAIIMPMFFFIYCIIVNPFSLEAYLEIGSKSAAFHLLMLTLIMVGVYFISRSIFTLLYRYLPFLWWHYAIWCLCEVLFTSLFFAMYTALCYLPYGGTPYFNALGRWLQLTSIVLIFPYLICILLRIISNKEEDIKEVMENPEKTLVKFYDYNKKLKLTIASSAIIYVSAEANYIDIHYIENGKLKSFMLRNSMKSIEGGTAGHKLVRCHRSYFVNPRHIKLLSKDKDGIIYTEFDVEDAKRIPVSKQYYDTLANLL